MYLISDKIFHIKNSKKLNAFFLLTCWIILFFSSSAINRDIVNSANAQEGEQYAPGFVLTGSNYQDTASSSSLQLSQFSVATWFKTTTNFGSDSLIVNKGGLGSDNSGQNMN